MSTRARPVRRGSAPLLDTELLRRRRRELGMSERALAKALGVTAPTVTALEAGTNHGDLPLALLLALIDALSLDPASVLRPRTGAAPSADRSRTGPPAAAADADADTPRDRAATAASDATPVPDMPATTGTAGSNDDDECVTVTTAVLDVLAARCGSLLHATGVLTSTEALAAATGSDLPAVTAALDLLETALRPAGLRVHRLNGDVALARTADTHTNTELTALLRLHHNRKGLTLREAQVVHDLMHGRTKHVGGSNPTRVALGAVTNAGHVATGQLTLSDDCRYSLLLDDLPDTTARHIPTRE